MKARTLIGVLAAVAVAGCGASPSRPESFRASVQHADAGGTPIAWYERGRGPALVMLMGTGSTMSEWDPALLRLLARGQRLILFDYPGIGLSGPWRGPRTFDSLADSTAALMDAIGCRARERARVVDGRLRRPAPRRRPSRARLAT